MNLEEKERKEIEFWRSAPEEKPDVFSIPNLINKFGEAAIFIEKLSTFSDSFRKAGTILELGGGQGWSACMVKHFHSEKQVYSSDISPYAVAAVPQWEQVFRVKLDHKFTARSYEIDLPDASVDLIYTFASAHHFVRHRRTLSELHRILKPKGKILYFHEPVCRRYIYAWSTYRVNKKRPMVPEDVLVYEKLLALGRKAGFSAKLHFSPSLKNRSPFGTMYYAFLRLLPFMQNLLPCTGDFEFNKK